MRNHDSVKRAVPHSRARAPQRGLATRQYLAPGQFGFDEQVRASMEALERSYALLAATGKQAGRLS